MKRSQSHGMDVIESSSMASLHRRVTKASITQERFALSLGYDPTLLSRIIRGLRPAPEGFEARVNNALDRLEAAERAWARVFAEGE